MSVDNELEITILFVETEDEIVVTADPIVVSVMVPEVDLYVDDTTDVLVIALGNIGPPGRQGDEGPQGPEGPPGLGGDGTSFGVVDAKGDIVVGISDNNIARLPVGDDGETLVADSSETLGVKWISPATTLDDLSDVDSSTGLDDEDVLSWDETVSRWVVKPAVLDLDFEAKGDLIVGNGFETNQRLPLGSNGQVLTVDTGEATGMKWAAVAGGAYVPLSTVDAKGDLLVGTANDIVSRLAVGADGQVLQANSGQTTGLKWENVDDLPGSKFRVGSGVPSNGVGALGDLYIDILTRIVYRKDLSGANTVTYRSQSGYATSVQASTHNVTKPAGVVSGDVLIAFGRCGSGSTFTSLPSGWTRHSSPSSRNLVATKIAGGSEPSTYAFTTPLDFVGITMIAYSGAIAVDAYIEQAGADQSGTVLTIPSITTTVSNDMLIGLIVMAGTTSTTITPSAGWTLRLNYRYVNISTLFSSVEKVAVTPGVQAATTITAPANVPTGHAWTIALNGVVGITSWFQIGTIPV